MIGSLRGTLLDRAVTGEILIEVSDAVRESLIESMDTEVVVHDNTIIDAVPGDPIAYEAAVERALAADG